MKQLLYIDLFCGAGGTSTGVNAARLNGDPCAKVIACVNHDRNAIASHAANHPEALHFTEDIRTLDLLPLMSHVREQRLLNPFSLIVLWASLECTNFSKAKGGQPRDADSRTLAEHLFRYIENLNPDYIQIENVEEFMSWGDVDKNGKPVSKDKGRCYLKWIENVKQYGYEYDYRILNAANYGAYTTRKRFFGIFAKHGLPSIFPEPTHCKNPQSGLFDYQFEKWNAVKHCLDLEDEGKSIFDRKKPLAEKTLSRIYAGLIKFVAGGKDAFLVKYNSMNKNGKYIAPGIDEPCPTVACQNRLGIAKVKFLSKQFSGDPYSKNISIEEPAGTITCIDHHAFITAYYGTVNNHSLDEPCPTLLTKDKFGLIKVNFIDNQFGTGTPTSIETATGTLLTNPKQGLVTVKQWILNPQFDSKGSSLDEPCFTLIARTDKRPPYLVTAKSGAMAIIVYDTDSPMMVKIKEFMAMYCIVDIVMRMFKVSEMKKIMGFPEDYILMGTQADQKKFIGNAVEVTIARKWCEALCTGLKDFDIRKYKSRLKVA